MKTLRLALSFLTTIPFPAVGLVADEEMGRTIAFFPLVGLIVGAINTAPYLIGRCFWSPAVAAWLWLIANALVTGGLHLDGWMDTFDALGSRKSQAEMLSIMKDSRIGAMGGMAAVLLLGFKWSLLAEPNVAPAVVFLAPMVGRSAVLFAAQSYAYGREKGLGHAFTQPIRPSLWVFALAVVVVPLFFLAGIVGLVAGTVSVCLALLWARMLSLKFGGLTGDTYGALNEVTEVLFLFFVLTGINE